MLTYEQGTYDAEVVAQGHGLSTVKETPYWAVTCRVLSRQGPDGRPRACPVHEREVRVYVPGGNTDYLAEALAILGVTGDQIDPESPAYAPLAGRRVLLRCSHRVYRDRPQEEWRLARPARPAAGTAAATISAMLAARPAPPRPEPAAASPGLTESQPQ